MDPSSYVHLIYLEKASLYIQLMPGVPNDFEIQLTEMGLVLPEIQDKFSIHKHSILMEASKVHPLSSHGQASVKCLFQNYLRKT